MGYSATERRIWIFLFRSMVEPCSVGSLLLVVARWPEPQNGREPRQAASHEIGPTT
jgi:hypothetical protein